MSCFQHLLTIKLKSITVRAHIPRTVTQCGKRGTAQSTKEPRRATKSAPRKSRKETAQGMSQPWSTSRYLWRRLLCSLYCCLLRQQPLFPFLKASAPIYWSKLHLLLHLDCCPHSILCFWYWCLSTEFRAVGLLGKHTTTELRPGPSFLFEIGTAKFPTLALNQTRQAMKL